MAERDPRGTSRRRFIQAGALFTAAAVAWQAWGRRPMASDSEAAARSGGALTEAQLRTLRAAFVEFLDDEDDGDRAARGLDEYLAGEPEQAAEMALAVTLLEMVPGGPLRTRRFSRLSRPARAEVLRSWAASSLGVRRQVHKGLQQAARFVHFSGEATWEAMGYVPPWTWRERAAAAAAAAAAIAPPAADEP